MKYINQEEINKILMENEKENVYHEIVQAKYAYQLEDIVTGKTHEKIETHKMIRFRKDNESFFILNDLYKDSEPSSFIIKESELADSHFTILHSEVYSLTLEEKRINKVLAEKLGGQFSLEPEGFTLIQARFCSNPNGFTLFEGSNYALKEITKEALALKAQALHSFHWSAYKKDSEGCQEASTYFDRMLEKEIKKLQPHYEREMDNIKAEETHKKEFEQKEKQRKADLKESVILQTAKSNLLEKFGYYPKVSINEKDTSEITISFYNSKSEIIDNIPLKLDVVDVLVSHDSDDNAIYDSYSVLNMESINNISDKKYDEYFKTFYLLESSIITENVDDLANIKEYKNSENKIFELDLDNENALMKSLNYTFNNPHSLDLADNAHKAFKESMKSDSKVKYKP